MARIVILLSLLTLIILVKLNKSEELNLNFFQSDYHVIPERLEVVRYNEHYVKHMSMVTFKYNRTRAAANSSLLLKVDVGNQLEYVTQMYKFASNEYRLFPLRVQINFCNAFKADVIGIRTGFRKCGNYECPLVKGRTYTFCNWSPDESKLPAYIPTGRYMAEVQATYFSQEVYVFRAYGEITRPIVF